MGDNLVDTNCVLLDGSCDCRKGHLYEDCKYSEKHVEPKKEIYRTLRVLIRRNLKMTTGKAAAQSVHAAIGLMKLDPREHHRCTVLEASDAEFERQKIKPSLAFHNSLCYVVTDSGKTEVDPGSETALAYWEEEEKKNEKLG